MRRSKRFEVLEKRPINQDVFMKEWPEKGFVAMKNSYDPKTSLIIENGKIIEMDGKKREEFDFIDSFIADHSINIKEAVSSMKLDSLYIARMLVDINVPIENIIRIF
jgi:propanediol dehydratase large subunit